jgi:hypothetical protein
MLEMSRVDETASATICVKFREVQEELDCSTLGDGTDTLSRNVGNYQSTPRNI